jgi:preprotein translocase subunit SecE
MKKNFENKLQKTGGKKKKVNVIKFAKEVKNELKKVVWPTKAQLINHTVTVLIACAIVGVIIFIADSAFLALSRALFG